MTTTTKPPPPRQRPYAFACLCGHGQRGIAYPSEIRRIWHEYCQRHRRELCEPRIERDYK